MPTVYRSFKCSDEAAAFLGQASHTDQIDNFTVIAIIFMDDVSAALR